MPTTLEMRIDIGEHGLGTTLHTAVRVVAPDRPASRLPVLFGFPGGGYNRRYFDLEIDGHPGYSQARHHAQHGSVFVACDHVGVGDSDNPDTGMDVEAVARANSATATAVLERLRIGGLHPDLPPIDAMCAIGIGQSYGGFLLTLAQATLPVFDGVVFLGWSGIATTPPWPIGLDRAEILAGRAGNGLDHPKRPWFHTDEVPLDIVELDMTKIPGTSASHAAWSTPTGAGGPHRITDRDPLTPGVVKAEAAAIRVPVFVGAGEIDVVSDLWSEAAAYTGSDDVTLCRFRRMAHMHNFAATRHVLWNRLDHWVGSVSSARQARESAMEAGTAPR